MPALVPNRTPLLPTSEMPPVIVFVPLELLMTKANGVTSLVPVITKLSGTVMLPESDTCPPVVVEPVAAMVVEPTALPKALALLMATGPTFTFTAPSKVLLPLS